MDIQIWEIVLFITAVVLAIAVSVYCAVSTLKYGKLVKKEAKILDELNETADKLKRQIKHRLILSTQDTSSASSSNTDIIKDVPSNGQEDQDVPLFTEEDKLEFKEGNAATRAQLQMKNLMKLLRRIGTQPELEEETEHIHVDFQGESFILSCLGTMVVVWDPTWWSVAIDSPTLNYIRTAINIVNFSSMYTGVLSYPDEEGTMYVSTKTQFIFTPDIPSPDELLRFVFQNAFIYKKNFSEEINELKESPERIRKLLIAPLPNISESQN